MEYKDLNDNELIYMINESDENAYELIHKKYKNLIYKLAFQYSKGCNNIGIDINDLILEGTIGLDNAIKNYKEDSINSGKFSAFLYTCIERNMIALIRQSTIKRNMILNDSTYCEKNYLENIIDKNNNNPLEKALLKEDEKIKYKEIIEKLTTLEFNIFILKVRNYKNTEIEKLLNVDSKCINNAIYRIRKKAKLLNFN